MRRPVVVPRSPPPAVTSRWTLMGLIGSGMRLLAVTCPQPPAEQPLSRITRAAVLLSLVRAPALPPQHAYFGSQSHTPSNPGGSHLKYLDGGIWACVFGRPRLYPWSVRYGGWRKRDG